MLLQEPNNTVGFGLKLLVTDFFVVGRGMFGMLERDTEVPMLSRAQN